MQDQKNSNLGDAGNEASSTPTTSDALATESSPVSSAQFEAFSFGVAFDTQPQHSLQSSPFTFSFSTATTSSFHHSTFAAPVATVTSAAMHSEPQPSPFSFATQTTTHTDTSTAPFSAPFPFSVSPAGPKRSKTERETARSALSVGFDFESGQQQPHEDAKAISEFSFDNTLTEAETELFDALDKCDIGRLRSILKQHGGSPQLNLNTVMLKTETETETQALVSRCVRPLDTVLLSALTHRTIAMDNYAPVACALLVEAKADVNLRCFLDDDSLATLNAIGYTDAVHARCTYKDAFGTLLIQCIRQDNIDFAKEYLRVPFLDVNALGPRHTNALCVLTDAEGNIRSPEIANLLLDARVDLTVRDARDKQRLTFGAKWLGQAITRQQLNIAQILSQKFDLNVLLPYDVRRSERDQFYPLQLLYIAAAVDEWTPQKRDKTERMLLDAKADLYCRTDAVPPPALTKLAVAVYHGDMDTVQTQLQDAVVRECINERVRVSARDYGTPLALALSVKAPSSQREQIVRALADAKADVSAPHSLRLIGRSLRNGLYITKTSTTPLFLALKHATENSGPEHSDHSLVQLLLSLNADPGVELADGSCVLLLQESNYPAVAIIRKHYKATLLSMLSLGLTRDPASIVVGYLIARTREFVAPRVRRF